jgi:DNA-binding transcriptional ArsR family regulator
MEHETLFTATKWDILKFLERGPKSPIEISKGLGSSLANISQQLRLLEMAGLVKTRRITNRDKDKPRVLYSLAGNLSYLISTSDDFVDKRLFDLSDRNKVVLRIWFLEDKDLRYALEKAFWAIEQHLDTVETLVYGGIEHGLPVLHYAGDANLPTRIEIGGRYDAVILVRMAAGLSTDAPHDTWTLLYKR